MFTNEQSYVILLTKAGEQMQTNKLKNFYKNNKVVLLSGLTIFIVFFAIAYLDLKLLSDHGWHNATALNIIRFSFAGVCVLIFIITAINLIASRRRENKIKKQLGISDTLINCITLLAEEKDINKAIDSLLQILNDYFDGDRAYLFEFDYEKQTTSNSYEYAAPGITKQIEILQDVPLEVIDTWIKKFKETGTFYISSLDKDVDKDSDTYRILEMQDITSLIAVPLIENNVIIGFLGIDNPKINYDDLTLLSSATFFILDSIDRRETHSKLHRLSFEDSLTEVYNRNKFNNDIEEYENKPVEEIGIAYFDLNGLKGINDTEGHEAGDRFIKNAANGINSIFPDNTYRIGGDEFVVISAPVKKELFEENVLKAIRILNEKGISVSYGTSWEESSKKIEKQLSTADNLMYKNKLLYYRKSEKNTENGN